MALTLEQLKAQFKKNDQREGGGSRPNNYYPFWDMKVGEQAVVRFLPDKNPDNPLGFMVEKLMHTLTINGENKSVPCLKMYGEDCPICKVSSAFYKDEGKGSPNGKKYWRKKQHIAQALIIEDPLPPNQETGETHEGKVRFLALGYQLFEVIKSAFESGDLDDVPFSFDGGYNFVIKKTQQGEYSTYAISSRFKAKPSALDAEVVEFVQDNMVELSSLLPAHPGTEKVEAMLEAALTGAEYSASKGDDDDDSPPVSKPAAKKTAALTAALKGSDDDDSPPFEASKPAKVAAKPVVESDDENVDDEADKILAQIRARRGGKG